MVCGSKTGEEFSGMCLVKWKKIPALTKALRQPGFRARWNFVNFQKLKTGGVTDLQVISPPAAKPSR